MFYLSKSFTLLSTLVLIAFASLQLNDPDPVLWVAFYLLCAAVPLLVAINKPNRLLFILAVIACLLEMTRTVTGAYQYYLHMTEEPLMQSMNPAKPYIEEAREYLGSLIALILVSTSHWLARFNPKKA